MAHRKLAPHAKLVLIGKGTKAVPPIQTKVFLVRSNRFTAAVFNISKRALSEKMRSSVIILTGSDAFASSEFAALFERTSLPADIGGTLSTGSGGHCCRGVEFPALCDNDDALWDLYEGSLSPRMRTHIANRRSAKSGAEGSSSNPGVGTNAMTLRDPLERLHFRFL